MRILIDIPDEIYTSIRCGMRHRDDVELVMSNIANGIPIPDNATNEIETVIRRYTDEQTN